jgi:hypothetical protein
VRIRPLNEREKSLNQGKLKCITILNGESLVLDRFTDQK